MAEKCNTALLIPGFEGCCEIVNTGCIIYNGPKLHCILIDTYIPTLNDLIQAIDEKLCSLVVDYASLNYGCLSYLAIDTEKKFVEAVSKILCQILGTQRPDVDITSLSTLYDYYTQLNRPPVSQCIRTLVPALPEQPTLHQLLTAIQEQLCLVGNRQDVFVKVSENDTTSGYLYEQIEVGPGLVKSIVNPGANERVRVVIDYTALLTEIKTNTVLKDLFCSIVALCEHPGCIEINYNQ